MRRIDSFLSHDDQSLDPDDLRIAADAFEAALPSLDDSIPDPHAARQNLARFVIERAFRGERDAAQMHADALDYIEVIRRNSVA